jgi:PilZ domain
MVDIAHGDRRLGNVIYRLIIESQESAACDRRAASPRHPFFRPISVRVGGRKFSAFSRDISETGIGLLHSFDLPLGKTEIIISSEKGYSVAVLTRIVWCRACGEGWYLSGGEFISAPNIGV